MIFAHDQQHRAVGIRMRGLIDRFQAEYADDDDLAAERARKQEEQGRVAALAAAQGSEEESDDDEGPSYRPKPLFRRMGLPARVLVDRVGDVYSLSRTAGNEAIDSVLWFRREALEYYKLPPTPILPYSVHTWALKRFKNWFVSSKLARQAWRSSQKFAAKGDTYGSQTLPQRGGTPSRSAGEWRYGRPLRQTPRRSAGYWCYGRSLAESFSRVDVSGVTVDPLPNGVTVDPLQRRGVVLRQTPQADP